jgi:hypothetical protein
MPEMCERIYKRKRFQEVRDYGNKSKETDKTETHSSEQDAAQEDLRILRWKEREKIIQCQKHM